MSARRTTYCIFVVLLLTMFTSQYTCECGQIQSRFYYNNQRSKADAEPEPAAADAEADTKLKLLEENLTDPIPMEFYKQLDSVHDLSELIDLYVDKDSIDPKVDIQGSSKINVERASVVRPKPVSCSPESTIVPLTPLNDTYDPGVFYYPSCTHVNRCGGCCSSILTTCQPTQTEIINFVIQKFRYEEGKKIKFFSNEVVLIEEHKACSCSCLIKATDCNSYQSYDPSRCICKCKQDSNQCSSQDHKIWDEQKCRCVCRDTDTCTTGTIFDDNQCKCVETGFAGSRASSSLSKTDRRRFIVKAIPVDPDNSTIYSV